MRERAGSIYGATSVSITVVFPAWVRVICFLPMVREMVVSPLVAVTVEVSPFQVMSFSAKPSCSNTATKGRQERSSRIWGTASVKVTYWPLTST